MFKKTNKIKSFFKNTQREKTFFDDFNKSIINDLMRVDVYFRNPNSNLIYAGNWVIDLIKKDDSIISIKLLPATTELQLIYYIKPLQDALKEDIFNIEVKRYYNY
jgi:hypothetical protein